MEYKNGLRSISLLAGADGGISKPTMTVREIEKILSPEVSFASFLVPSAKLGRYVKRADLAECLDMATDTRTAGVWFQYRAGEVKRDCKSRGHVQ